MPFPDELERKLEVLEYQPQWPADFDRIAELLRGALGPAAVRIDHVGSTSVPGLPAKDCIDIQVIVPVLDEDELVAALGTIGFRCRPESWNRDDTYDGTPYAKLVFAPPVGGRSCNIHVRAVGTPNARRMLLFRDFLRANETVRDAWGAFKTRLSESVPDLFGYGQIKQPATVVLFEAAELWARTTYWTPGEGI
ncbi:GrpB family protein [Kribbella antiqua]|uniref:GrpB family protein n=1 Tax=Kribbella antiqua TaxID=2512217 RepID=UPI0018EE8B66|nr:GrpB family protein [Kribbella antiqua]